MAAGKSTLGVDRITPKQSGGLRIVFSVNAQNETDVPLTSLQDNDYITKKQFLANAGGPAVQATFSAVTGLTINWQTDIPSGYSNTYAQLLGNDFPKPMIYVSTGTNQYTQMSSYSLVVNYDSFGNITSLVFDWGDSQTGTIQF